MKIESFEKILNNNELNEFARIMSKSIEGITFKPMTYYLRPGIVFCT